MRQILLFFGLGFAVAACNSGTNTAGNQTDTTNHTAYNTTKNNATGQNHMKAMHDAMNSSMEQMKTMSMSGDPDHDFALMMMQHHKSAVDMAQAELAGGTDEAMKQIAQKIIDEQQKEMDQFNAFMQGGQPQGNKSDYGQKVMGMMTPMSDIKMESSSLDAMFASMMIPHHQDAVKMAQEYLKVGKSEELKKIARSIVQTQPKEIEQLQQWLSNHQ